jgi:hypothetical protein
MGISWGYAGDRMGTYGVMGDVWETFQQLDMIF